MYKKVRLSVEDRAPPAPLYYGTRYVSFTDVTCAYYGRSVAGAVQDYFTGATLDITPLPGPVDRRLTRPCLPKQRPVPTSASHNLSI
jgi:hypothetical protein